MVNNKKGWLRIVESIFAILIMAGVLLVVYGQHTTSVKTSDYIVGVERNVLSGISENYTLRYDVLAGIYTPVKDYVTANLDSRYSYVLVFCNLSDISCESSYSFPNKEIYSEEIVVSSTANEYSPKIVKLLSWVSDDVRVTEFSGALLSNGKNLYY